MPTWTPRWAAAGASILDQAGWHSSKGLLVPPNIELVHLPPRSPELNPVERLRDWLKRNCVRNRFYETLEEIMDALEECMRDATEDALKSMCACNYLALYKCEMV